MYLVQGEKLTEYYSRLSVSLYQGKIPYWTEIHSRVSIYDNFLLWGYSYLPGHTHFKEFEFALPQKAIDRGVGACSQVARLAYYIVADQKIPSMVVSQSSHVVLELENGVLDAYHGVYIPFGIAQITKNPDILDKYYPRNSSDMRIIYSQKWDYPKNQAKRLNYMMRMELIAEIMKWIIPTLMILIGFLLVVKNWFYNGKHTAPP